MLLLKAILKERSSYSKQKIATLMLHEVLGEQFLLNEEHLEPMAEVIKKIG